LVKPFLLFQNGSIFKTEITSHFFFIFFLLFKSEAQIENQQVYYSDSSSYDVTCYSLNLSASDDSKYITGNTQIFANVTNRDLAKFYIELSDSLKADSVFVENLKVPFIHKNGWVKANLAKPINNGKKFSVKIFYQGNGYSNGSFGGMGESVAYSSNVLYVLAEPFSASVFFPCKQLLTDKADSVFVHFNVPIGQVVASNGLLKSKTTVQNNYTTYNWETRYPTAYYLIAFAISDYVEYSYHFYDENYGDSIFFQNFVYSKDNFLDSSKNEIDETVKMIKLYEKITGIAFPFRKEKYGHVTAPIGGGMENQTMTMVSDFDFTLVAHELGHSWFGDYVTCSDWQNIWINEGCASYMEYLANEKLNPAQANEWLRTAMVNALSQPSGSIYVPDDGKWDDQRIFNYSLSYKKGALLLHMLRKNIDNDSIFFKVLNNYLSSHAYSNASADDFKIAAEQVTGLNLDKFFAQWYYGQGFPILHFDWKLQQDSLLVITHCIGSAASNPLFNFNLEVLLHLENSHDSILKLPINDTLQQFSIKLTSPLASIELNTDYSAIVSITSNPPVLSVIPEIQSQMSKRVSVFPNPFYDSTTVHFYSNSKSRNLELFDLKGRSVGKWMNVDKDFVISGVSLNQGIYLLRSTDNYGPNIIKIVKENR
jgi:aminopeptidase N